MRWKPPSTKKPGPSPRVRWKFEMAVSGESNSAPTRPCASTTSMKPPPRNGRHVQDLALHEETPPGAGQELLVRGLLDAAEAGDGDDLVREEEAPLDLED